MESHVEEEEEDAILLSKPECHGRLDIEILIPFLSHIQASRSCLSFNAYNFGDGNNTGASSSASSSSSASPLSLRGVSEHLEVSNLAKDDLELIYFAICANPDVNSSTTLNDLNAATTTSSQAVRIEVLKSSHNNQLLTDVTVIHGSSMSDVRQLADLLRKRPTPEKSSFGLPLAYGTRAHLWHISNHGAELLGRAISDDTTLHALDLCSCCVGTKKGLEILLQPFTTNEAGQQPNSSSISNPFVSWNDFDASGCLPATKRFSQQTNSVASLYQILEGSVSSPELSGSAGLLSASIIGILISLRETHTLQQLEVQCCPSIKGNEVLGTIFDLLQVNISMEKISFNGTSLEQDGSEKHLIQSVLLDQAAKNQPPLEGQEVSNIEPMSRRVSLSIPPLKAGCSSSCIGSGAYIDKGKSVSYGNGHQRQKCKPWEWTKTKVQAMGMGKRQRLRKEINQEEDGIDCDVEALSIAVVNVEPMTTIAPQTAKVDPIEPGSIEECMLCRDSTPEDNLFLTSCGHRFCFNCIKEFVGVIIQAQMATRNLNFSSLAACPHCPITSCQSELSRSELMKLLGQKTVQAYERWLLSAYERLFGSLIQQRSENPSLLNLCSSAICDPTNPTMVLSTSFHDLFPLKEKKEGSKVFLCTSCDAAWCAFCGGQLPVIQEEHTGNGNNNDNRMHADCSGQEKFLLFKCMVELKDACQIYTQGSCQMVMNPEHTTSQKRNRISIWADGTGYGGDYNENKIQTEFMQAEAKRKEAEVDTKVASAFQFLTCILNNSHHHTGGGKRGDEEEETSCCSPITTATYVLLFGWGNTLQQLLLQLVTNDSMLDISERSNLYFKMVELLKAITTHKELFLVLAAGYNTTTTTAPLKMVAKEALQHDQVILQRRTSRKSLNKVLNEDDNAFVVMNKDSTLIKKMENIYTQAKVMLQQFQSAGMSTDEAAVDMDISLAKQLCVCYELMQEKEMTQGGCVTKLAAETTMHLSLEEATQSNVKRELLEAAAAHKESIQIVKNVPMNYKEKLRPLQFKQMSMVDENGTYSHHFKDHIMGKVSASSCIDRRGVHNHKRMLHLSKEIALLATTLPLEWGSSIHLCVDDQRLDVLRALIIGPHATPYQNGIFLFDIFLPPDYPQVPPSVHFMTTGGGGVRFNPNLYNSGKICLSLLGTWNGPGWIPGRSTLLQVLVSIQSLIFVQNPYYNEPGYEKNMHCSEAENENMHHREHTLALAILAPLRRPDAMFADVISEHFKHKREEVEQQCQQWCAYASDINTKNRMANLMKDIKAQLQTLCCSA